MFCFQGKLCTEILNMSLPNKAKAVYSNSRQLAAQYDKKRQDVESSALRILYKPYEPLNEDKYLAAIQFTEAILENESRDPEKYRKLILLSEEIMELSLGGLDYYQNYYQRPLLVLVTLSFIGWILCLVKALTEQKNYAQAGSSNTKKCNYRKNEKFVKHFTATNILFSTLSIISAYLVFGKLFILLFNYKVHQYITCLIFLCYL